MRHHHGAVRAATAPLLSIPKGSAKWWCSNSNAIGARVDTSPSFKILLLRRVLEWTVREGIIFPGDLLLMVIIHKADWLSGLMLSIGV